ncbi:hypothetical protein [Desemzia sp. FAM 23991]|uniref:hypothetical protein n=1 Tax=unclassified Desemzia TaxID=2685243 RepID=UPI003888216B
MKNLPTLDEMITFLKDSMKIIIITTVSIFSLFLLGIGYTIFTDSKINENAINTEEQEIKLNELDQNIPFEAQLDPEEIELIMKNFQKNGGVAFSFYTETETGEPFLANSLMEELLISQNVLERIEEGAGTTIEPSPDLALQVTLNPNTQVMTLKVGTGDKQKNQVIADAYFDLISQEDNSFFDNKTVYIVTEPEVIKSYEIESEAVTESDISVDATNDLSYKRIILYAVLAVIVGGGAGIFIALIRNLLKKEVTDLYGFAIKDNDTVLNMSNNKYLNNTEKYDQLIHAVLHPEKKIKLVLSEENLDNYIVEKLNSTSKEQLEKKQYSVLFTNSVSEVNPAISVDEVIIICKKYKTTKKWYEKQRELLKVYRGSEIKVILI